VGGGVVAGVIRRYVGGEGGGEDRGGEGGGEEGAWKKRGERGR